MRFLFVAVPLSLIISCCIAQKPDSLTNKNSTYYLTDLPLRKVAMMILRDEIQPSDNLVTFRVMDSILSVKKETRDYYFPVFLKIAAKADGALGEVVGDPILEYVKRFPREFATRFYRCYDENNCGDVLRKLADYAGWETIQRNESLKEYNELLAQLNKNYKKWRSDKILSSFMDRVTETRKKEEQ